VVSIAPRHLAYFSIGWLLAGTLAAAPWESFGPPGCRVRGIAQHPSQPQVLFMGCEWAAYRSGDSGETWQELQDERIADVRSLELAPSNPPALYIATSRGLLRSRDEGESWCLVSEGFFSNVRSVEVDPSDPSVVYASAIEGGLHRTRDGGDTWEPLGITLGSVGVSPLDPELLYGFRTDGFIVRSDDGGVTWARQIGMFPGISNFEFDLVDRSTVFAAVDYNGLYRTKDDGATWEGLTSRYGITPVAIRENPRELWTADVPGIQVSTDGGDTWEPIHTEPVMLTGVSEIFLDPSAPSRAFVGSASGLFETVDRGGSWVRKERGTRSSFITSLASQPAGEHLLAGTVQGIGRLFRSTDSGGTWVPRTVDFEGPEVAGVAIAPSNPDYVYAAIIYPLNVCPGWCPPNGKVFESRNGGETWQTETGWLYGLGRGLAVDPMAPTTAYATSSPFLKRTEAQGWMGTFDIDSEDVAIDLQDPSVLYLATRGLGVWTSHDSGETFEHTSLTSGQAIAVAIDPHDRSIIWAATTESWAGDRNSVMRSPDGGVTWEPRDPVLPLSDAPISDLQVHPDWGENVFVSMGDYYRPGGVLESRDAGLTWQPLFEGLRDRRVTQLAFTRGGLNLHAATLGSGVVALQLPYVDAESGPYAPSIDAIAAAGVTAGCGRRRFCTDDPVTRAQSSVFLLRSLEGSMFEPPPATGTLFTDVPADAFAAAWIEEIADRGITAGCGGGFFCPEQALTRAQAAVLSLRTRHGSSYEPPPATGTMFTDVPLSHFAAAYIEEFARQGHTAGCAPSLYCPEQAVSRGQMAVFLAGVFSLL
jgi:photosystem II stability/assembly factor-like uncharacterized protein